MPESVTQKKDKDTNTTGFQSEPTLLLRFRRPLIVLAHLIVFAASLMLSFLVTSNMQFKVEWFARQYPVMLALFAVVKVVVFGLFKQYHGWWRYVGISDLIGIIRASLISTVIIVVLWYTALQMEVVRKSLPIVAEVGQGIFMADLFGTIFLLAGLRMAIRLYHDEFQTVEGGRLKRFLIVGAGNTGESLLREIQRMPVAEYELIGFIDDNPAKQGLNIHDIPVLGTVEQLAAI
jgi:FlaA1/EpsC-like NDP-sugar epimerase